MATTQSIIDTIEDLRDQGSPVAVGISGFGGSGKSTITRQLNAAIEGSARIRGDDFLDPHRSHQRSSDWDGVERVRLREEVLHPFRQGRPGVLRRFDWGILQLGAPEALPRAQVLIVDAIGLFHPELEGDFDLTIWVDLDLSTATARGKVRDRQLGRSHDQLWDEVWVPNERDFVARFDPRSAADHLFDSH